MIEASGCIFLSLHTGKILLQQRGSKVKHPNTWGFFGGKSEGNERPSETLYREIYEELGTLPNILKVIPLNKFTSPNKKFEYHSFVCVVPKEFIPILNEESNGYAWVKIGHYPSPLHPGANIQLRDNEFNKKVKLIYKTHKVVA
tara:strand:- start:557 stop:988 length:432 start_codon:yes stop_codon:yes gene_type:complete